MVSPRQIYLTIFVLFLLFVLYITFILPQSATSDKDDRVWQLIEDTNIQQNTAKVTIPEKQVFSIKHKATTIVTVWSHDLTGVWKQRSDICADGESDVVTSLVTPFGIVSIHVHDPKTDIWVSKRIINTGSFDLDKVHTLAKFLESEPSLNFIDIGSNLGVYSMSFAKLGRKVISIDALNLNMAKLCASVKQSHFEDNIYMVMNAVSSKHETVSLAADEKNFGGTFIDQNAEYVKSIKGNTVKGNHYNNISTIVLDDLLTLPFISLFPKVFIKMDIEGFEHKALEGAHLFFSNIFVRGIQIEWIFHRNKSTGQIIVKFLEQYSFNPYDPINLKPLQRSSTGNWATQDVLWLRHD